MNQQEADKIFNTGLGQQLDSFYCCSDNKVLIRYSEALKHVNGELDENTKPLEDKTITEWFPSDNCYNNLPESMDIGNNELGHY